MKPKNTFKKLSPLLKAPSFTSKEARALGVRSSALSYFVQQSELTRIGHGVYRGANAPTTDDFRWEDLIDAVQRTKSGIVCLSSALAIYDLTEEIPRQYWIAISNQTRHRAGKNTKVVRMRNIILGKTTIKIGRIALPIFDRERTIVDAFKYLSLETALKALKLALALKGSKKIDLDKIRQYSKILRTKIEPYLIAMSL